MSVSPMHRTETRPRRRIASHRRLTLLGVALFLVGCGGAPSREAVTVADSAGVTLVDNDEAQGAWTRDTAWRLAETPLVQIGNVPGDQTQQLYRVRHSIRLESGNIAVANTGLSDVRVYSAGGAYLRSLDMPYDEERKLIPPLRLHELPGDSLMVVLMDRTIAVYDSLGAMARRTGLLAADVASDPSPQVAGILGDGTVVMKAFPPADTLSDGLERTRFRLLTFGTDAAPVGSLGDFEHLTVLRGEGVYVFGPEGVEAVGDSTVWYGPADIFELREMGLDGGARRIVRLNRPGGEVLGVDTAAYMHSALGELERTMEEAAARAVVATYRFAERFPSYSGLVVDAEGNVWVKSYQWYGGLGQPQKWTVFGRDGRFLGDLTMPTLMEVHQIGEDFVLGRMADVRGREAIYYYPLVKPGAGSTGEGAGNP